MWKYRPARNGYRWLNRHQRDESQRISLARLPNRWRLHFPKQPNRSLHGITKHPRDGKGRRRLLGKEEDIGREDKRFRLGQRPEKGNHRKIGGEKMKPIHDSYIDRRGFVHCVEKDGETGDVLSDDVESEPDPDELNERMREEGR